MIYSVKELFERDDVEAAIQDNDLEYVYQLCTDEKLMTALLTSKLLAIGINPLEYVDCVYKNMYYCTNVKEVTIPSYVTRIEAYAFQGCSNLDKVCIEKGIERIEARAFSGCTNLSELVYLGTIAEWNNIRRDYTAFAGSYIRRIVCVDGVIDNVFEQDN